MTGGAYWNGRGEHNAALAEGPPGPPATSYDEIPYESFSLPQTHPGHLAAVATLFGMSPAPVDCCRVLELGCAAGGNLIPMALTLPGSCFVGMDLSARQVADGQRLVQALGLTNVELRCESILDIDNSLGLFNYIICHGVYSWVPAAVQDRILEVCARNLAPDGVAYVSYNTLPGWHLNGVVRDLLCYHARRYAQPLDRAAQARALLDFLASAVPRDGAYGRLLAEALELFGQVSDSYLLHDYLEEVNEPVYFHQFADRAAAKGLQYLAEVEVGTMLPGRFPPEVACTLEQLASDTIELEQFMDFLRGRKFRQTLLCHRAQVLRRTLSPEALAGLYVASPLKPAPAAPELPPGTAKQYSTPRGVSAATADPLLCAALTHLAKSWPQAVPFEELLAEARHCLGPGAGAGSGDAWSLGVGLLQLYVAGLVELRACASPFDIEARECSVTGLLAASRQLLRACTTNPSC